MPYLCLSGAWQGIIQLLSINADCRFAVYENIIEGLGGPHPKDPLLLCACILMSQFVYVLHNGRGNNYTWHVIYDGRWISRTFVQTEMAHAPSALLAEHQQRNGEAVWRSCAPSLDKKLYLYRYGRLSNLGKYCMRVLG